MFGPLLPQVRADGWWRAGPVAGHGLRLRKLRLTPCPAPPARGPSLPGRAPSLVLRSASVTSSHRQLLRRIRARRPPTERRRGCGLPPRPRANGCARVSSTADPRRAVRIPVGAGPLPPRRSRSEHNRTRQLSTFLHREVPRTRRSRPVRPRSLLARPTRTALPQRRKAQARPGFGDDQIWAVRRNQFSPLPSPAAASAPIVVSRYASSSLRAWRIGRDPM
jgi:hypothetical protein